MHNPIGNVSNANKNSRHLKYREFFIIEKNLFGLFSLCLFSCILLSFRSLCNRCFCNRSVSFLCRATATTGLLGFSLWSLGHVLIIVNQLDECNLSSVTLTGTELDDTSITARTVSYLDRNFLEEFGNSLLVLKITEYNTT